MSARGSRMGGLPTPASFYRSQRRFTVSIWLRRRVTLGLMLLCSNEPRYPVRQT